MRLLVFGGNAYIERTRIGSWSMRLDNEILQDRSGLSGRQPAYGVGFDDDVPYLIFRKVIPAGNRTYPITILLEPPKDIWSRFKWNAAQILFTLFGTKESIGNDLINDPESFYSPDSLIALWRKVTPSNLEDLKKCQFNEEKSQFLRDFWFGVFSLGKPIALDGWKSHLETRPVMAEMTYFLRGNIPPTLRIGTGWLVGGKRDQISKFGVNLILDGRERQVSDVEEKAIKKILDKGKQNRERFKFVHQHKNHLLGENTYLHKFVSYFDEYHSDFRPIPDKAVFKKKFSDIELIEYLIQKKLNLNRKTDKKEDVNEKIEGKIYERCIDADSKFDNILREMMVELVKDNPSWSNSRLNFIAEFFPSNEIGTLNLEDTEKLKIAHGQLKNLKEDIPEFLEKKLKKIFPKERELDIEPEDWSNFANSLVLLTRDMQDFGKWDSLTDDKSNSILNEKRFTILQKLIRENTKKISLNRICNADLTDFNVKNYLIYAEDTGGFKLTTNAPKRIQSVIDFCLEKDDKDIQLNLTSINWLSQLIYSYAFQNIKSDKSAIVNKLQNGNKEKDWLDYIKLIEILNFKREKFDKTELDEIEEKNLLYELDLWKKKLSDRDSIAPPKLKIIVEFFSGEYRLKILKIFKEIKPHLSNKTLFSNWLEDWFFYIDDNSSNGIVAKKINYELYRYSKDLSLGIDSNPLKLVSSDKYKVIRQLCFENSSNVSLWSRLASSLLSDGEVEESEIRCQRFRLIFIENDVTLNEQFIYYLRNTVSTEEFARRVYAESNQDIRDFLNTHLETDQKFIDELLNKHEKKLINLCKAELLHLEGHKSHAEEGFSKKRQSCLEKFGEKVFDKSIKPVYEEFKRREIAPMVKVIGKYLSIQNDNAEAAKKRQADLSKIIYSNLFRQTSRNSIDVFKKVLEKNKKEYEKNIIDAVQKFIDLSGKTKENQKKLKRESKAFYDNYLKDLSVDRLPISEVYGKDEKKIYRPRTSILVDEIFSCLPACKSQMFIETLLKNGEISNKIHKILYSEFKKFEDKFETLLNRGYWNSSKHEPTCELRIPEFQKSCLKLISSLKNVNTEPLLAAKKSLDKSRKDYDLKDALKIIEYFDSIKKKRKKKLVPK